MTTSGKKQEPTGTSKLLPRFSLFVFDRTRLFVLLWVALTAFGILSYTTFMQRQGFPSINVPYSVINGVYFANDPQKVDAQVAKPISDIAMQDSRVSTVQATSQATFYSVIIQYKDGTNAQQAGQALQQRIRAAHVLPKQATIAFTTPKMGFTMRGDDAVISVYSLDPAKTTQDLAQAGTRLSNLVQSQHLSMVQSASIVSPFVQGINPATGKVAETQKTFDRFGERQGDTNVFFGSVTVGATEKQGADVIKFDKQLRTAASDFNQQEAKAGLPYRASVSASYAPQIKQQISELQRALLEGLLVVLVVGSLVIAIRASIITVLSMVTVLAATLALLFTIGYTLNTITLFSLILALALIVDDTIIMVEAIDAERRRSSDPRTSVHLATAKIGRAMIAATLTAVLSFSPLLFVGGILGSFVREIPVTVISSLLVSLVVALVFIPVFARYLLLGKKQMGAKNVHEPAARFESKVAQFIGKPMLWAQHSIKKLVAVGLAAVIIGFVFIGAGGYVFQKVTFNIFPPSKDTNGLIVNLAFPPNTTIQQAQQTAQQTDAIVAKTLGTNFQSASYYATGSAQSARLFVSLVPYTKRHTRSPQLVDALQSALNNFAGAKVTVQQQDISPPPSPFTVRVETPNRQAALNLADAIQAFLQDKTLTRPSGTQAKIVSTSVSDPQAYVRANGKQYMLVTANFNANDTTTLVNLAKSAVLKEFTPQKVASYGLDQSALVFDFGQESENQNSFRALVIAFPLVLLAIYLLLALQFRSLAQPLLIFMAIPFSLLGITGGLYLTNNAFSFFAMLGFFALIGLSLKNTILLTDYANQRRRAGQPAVQAAVEALSERFRPLVATSLTAVVSLVPLALTSPFWEGLAVVLIFGLLSSTLLVIFIFPYYYLGVEFLRLRTGRAARKIVRKLRRPSAPKGRVRPGLEEA